MPHSALGVYIIIHILKCCIINLMKSPPTKRLGSSSLFSVTSGRSLATNKQYQPHVSFLHTAPDPHPINPAVDPSLIQINMFVSVDKTLHGLLQYSPPSSSSYCTPFSDIRKLLSKSSLLILLALRFFNT